MHQPTNTPACNHTYEQSLHQQKPCHHQHILSTKSTEKQGRVPVKSCQQFTAHILWKTKQTKKNAPIFLKTMQCAVFPEFICAWDMKGQTCKDCLLCECFHGLCVVLMLQLFMEDSFKIIWQVLNPAMTVEHAKGIFCKYTMWGCWEAQWVSNNLKLHRQCCENRLNQLNLSTFYRGWEEAQAFSTDPKN